MTTDQGSKLCECVHLREPSSFAGANDYRAFTRLLEQSPVLARTPVQKPYLDAGLSESWHECRQCGTVWRLVVPDPPFTGLWNYVS